MNGAAQTNGCDGSHDAPQPIAIIGYACRLPGQVSSPSDLWELCTRRRSGWKPIPKDRFSFDAFHHPNPSKLGTTNPAGGYFLDEDIGRFDAPFFNVTVQEAISMDPQQRMLLECSYEALESAGIPKESLSRRSVGVFVGGNFADYELNNVRDVETIPLYQATGCANALQSNRISYFFDLAGPSLTVDTACSSSLVALHYAVQSLRSGESKEALVAGCHLNVVPDLFVSMSMSQLFNDDGKTFAFEERAKSGFARGEGAGVVMLKTLDAAMRDGDPVRAVILNSGVNQDGRTKGITLPNGLAQEELIRRVYQEAHLNPDDCAFAEMHGTGTKAGDPIEAAGVHAALGQNRSPRNPLYIGSVKSNVGHLEGASGVISIIKAAMMLDNGLLLPNADYKKPNPNIPLNEYNMKVVASTRPWPRGKKYVSVSNYGFGGTNAHVVLEKPPLNPKPSNDDEDNTDPKTKLFLISANDKESLRQRIHDFTVYFEQRPEVFEKALFGNFAYTIGNKSSQLAYRVGLSATSLDDLGVRLAQLKVNPVRVHGAPTISFVFTGQGAQWAQMGVPLMDQYPVFASAVKRADMCLMNLGAEFSLVEELRKDGATSKINSPHLSQPACTALQIGLVLLLESWGIRPASVVGHSSGEISAAFAAGVYDLESAMALAYRRGQMTQLLKASFPSLQGTMIAIGAGRDAVEPMLKTIDGYATVACVNSPSSVTVSGDVPAIAQLENILQDKQLFNRRLKIDVAYHSDHMKNVADEYLAAIASIQPSESATAVFYSSVFGRIADASELGPSYWVQNLTSPVLFPDALGKMCAGDSRPNLLVEVGPHSALKGPIMDTLKSLGPVATKIGYAPTVLRNADAAESILGTAAAAYTRGAILNMTEVNFPCTGAKNRSFLTDLPRYPWQHGTRYWHESRISQKHTQRDGARNDILGVMANYSNDLEPTWRNIVRLDDIPWLRDHKMQGMTVYPLAGYLAMAIEAAQRRATQHDVTVSQFELREVKVGSALVLSDDVDVETTITLRPFAEGTRGTSDVWDEFRICSWNTKRGWTEHCSGLIRIRAQKSQAAAVSSHVRTENLHVQTQIAKMKSAATYKIDSQHMYKVLTDVGAGYGPTFQGIENCFADPYTCRADLFIRDTRATMPKEFEPKLTVHPAFLDGLLHLVWPILGQGRMELDTLYMPTMIKQFTINRVPTMPGEFLKIYGNGSPSLPVPEPTRFDLFATPENSTEVLMNMEGLIMTPLREAGTSRGEEIRNLCYKFEWQPLANGERVNGVNGDVQISNGDEMNGHAANDHTNGQAETNGHATNGGSHINGIDGANGSNGANGHADINGHATNGDINGTNGSNGANGHADINGHATNGDINGTNGSNGTNGHADINGHATNGDINGTNGSNGSNGANGHADINGHATNGDINSTNGSNGANGHAVPNGTSHVNGNGVIDTVSESKNNSTVQQRELTITHFGKIDGVADQLCNAVGSGWRSAICSLDEIDSSKKHVVVLQTGGASSLRTLTTESFASIQKTLLTADNVLWVYRNDMPDAQMIVGLARTLRSEALLKVATLGLDAQDLVRPSEPLLAAIHALWPCDDAQPCEDFEFRANGSELLVPRAVNDDAVNSFVHNETHEMSISSQPFSQPGRRFKLQIGNPGALDTLYFVDDEPGTLGADDVEIEVKATGTNFKDIVVTMGQLAQPYIGIECSGVISSVGSNVKDLHIGQRVMAMPLGGYSTYARCKGTSVAPISDSMSFEVAATVPVVFCTAYYALFDLGQLQPGERVLIHAGAGGVGQAAIMLAQTAGADIFVTVGSLEKKQFLMTKYSIPEDRIFYSRDVSFGRGIKRATNNEGVDVVLNSLAGDLLRETWECLAPFGRFVEIGKADITKNTRLDMLPFEYNVTFSSVDLTKVAQYRPKLMKRLLNDVCRLMDQDQASIKPISPITTYRISELEAAFRTLQTGKNMGKLVVIPHDDDYVKAVAPKTSPNLLRADASYILIGGTGGLGRSMAKWMSLKGAKNIVLVSRRASVNNNVQALIDDLALNGTRVVVKACDVSSRLSADALIKDDMTDLPPVRGIVHGTMVLRDMLFEQMTLDDFQAVVSGKVDGAWNLHSALADSSLDFFIALSSVAGVVGNRGQGAYSAANVFLDGFMEYRRSLGLPGTSIDLAAVRDVGYLADTDAERQAEVLKNIGSQTVDESEVLALLAAAITGDLDRSSGGQCITGLGLDGGVDNFWVQDAKFSVLYEAAKAKLGSGSQLSEPTVPLRVKLQTVGDKETALQVCYSALAAKLSQVLVISPEDMDPSVTVSSLGLDSLVAIEIRNWIAREANANVQVLELLSSGSLMALAEIIVNKSQA